MTPSEAPKALQASECSELLDPMRASCWIFAQHQPGKFTNIGAGTITANYDGIKKHKTIIGDNCFIGSNNVLIAPIKIESSVTTGAGSVLNKNVENNSLAISRVRQKNIKNWKKSNQ